LLAAVQEAIALGRELAESASVNVECEVKLIAGHQIVIDDGQSEK
jgi:hypothetical protein